MKHLHVIALLLLWSCRVAAQDPFFSQFYANRVYLNPAYAGFDAGSTVTLNYRDQWFGIPDGDIGTFGDSYRTFNATFEQQIPCFFQSENANLGLALSAFGDEAGQAPLQTTGGALAISHERHLIGGTKVSKKYWLKRLDLRAGFQTSLLQRRLTGDFFYYSGQLDPVDGPQTDPSTLDLSSNLYPSINAGVMVRAHAQPSNFNDILLTLGLAVSNANEPGVSLMGFGEEYLLPRRWTAHLGLNFSIAPRRGATFNPRVNIAPQLRFDTQSTLNLMTVGSYVYSQAFYTGLFYQDNFGRPANTTFVPSSLAARNTATLIFTAGVDLKTLYDHGKRWDRKDSGILLGLSYDLNVSGLNSAATLGVIEINMRFNFGYDHRSRRDCGALGKFEIYDGKCPVRF